MNGDSAGVPTLSRTASVFTRLLATVRLGRPIFLLGGFALYALGTLAAVRRGYAFDLAAFLTGQLAVTAIQLMTHYANDYFDYEGDRANRTPTRWSGGSRVLVNGELPRIVALRAALLAALVAPVALVLLCVVTPERSQRGAVLLFVLMQVLAWSHSAPPLSLHSRGLGEVATAIVVPLFTPLAGFVVQAGRFESFPLVLSAPLGLLQLLMLVTIEFPDEAGDRAVGKKTWVVLFGRRNAARLAALLIVLAFASVPLGFRFGVPPRVGLGWLVLAPLALVQLFRLARGDFRLPSAWEGLTFGSVALYFLAVVVDLLALA